ncbi:MAG: 5'-methylthioadenosine/adenosylhomocysteine nucleosidase [Rhodoferax sp.]|nr:5'-methylthioadenosine/adenosylhomocysteine nucleosidase [Rhodoferax sp.]
MRPPRTTGPLAIVAAMEEELRAVLAQMPNAQVVSAAGRAYWCGHLHGQAVVAVLSRIGKVAAATTTTALLERFRARAVVFTGDAGGLADGVRVGDLIVAETLLQHDMDASPLFPRHEVPLYGHSRFATDPALRNELAAACVSVLADAPRLLGEAAMAEFRIHAPVLHHGLILSGDRFVSTGAESARLRAELPDALAQEMEGAAVAQVCCDYDVPFALVRVVSDRADDTAHTDFQRFIAEVARHYSAAIVEHLLRALPLAQTSPT